MLPELFERDLQERQRLRSAIPLGFAHQALHQIRLHVDPNVARREHDRVAQPGAAQRVELHPMRLEILPDRAAHQIAGEVGPHADQHRQAGNAPERSEPSEERRPRSLRILPCCDKDLLEWIDVEQVAMEVSTRALPRR